MCKIIKAIIILMSTSLSLHAESKFNIQKEAMIKGANGKMKISQIKLKQLRKKYFGPPPALGNHKEIEKFLKKNTNDPTSITIDTCSHISVDDTRGWLVGCTYFGNNSFGGKIKKSNWFIIKNGVVAKMFPLNEYKN